MSEAQLTRIETQLGVLVSGQATVQAVAVGLVRQQTRADKRTGPKRA